MASNSSFKPFLVSFGGEDLFLDRDIERVRKTPGRKVLLLDGEGMVDDYLINLCETYSEAPRTIILDNANKLKGDKALRAYINNKDPQDRSLVLVAILRSEKITDVWALAASKGQRQERKGIKARDTEGLINWVALEADTHRVSMGKDVAEALTKVVGSDLYRLANEVRKLAIYVGQGGRIEIDHIRFVTTFSPQYEPYQVADLAVAKNSVRALNAFSSLYQTSGDDCLVPVVYALMRQIEKTAVVRHLLDKGVGEADMAVVIGLNVWVVKNALVPIARKHDSRSLTKYMGRLCKLDADVKGSSKSKRTLVELTLLSIAS